MIGTPRIQGKVGQCDASDDLNDIGKWFFSFRVSGYGEKQLEYGPFGPWETEKIAKKKLEAFSEMFCNLAVKTTPETISGIYIDLKINKLKNSYVK